jgi:RNA polymerase sigma-70 factor (ECF subfamily)
VEKAKNQQLSETLDLPDVEVIDRILKGEKDLYAVIVRRYNQRLYRIGMSILNDDEEAEDAMQVAYINAWQGLKQFQFKSSFSTWLTRIMINECLFRFKKRKQLMDVRNNLADYYQSASHREIIFSKIMNKELKIELETAILSLPEKYRTVFILREIEELSVAETKECLAISEVNVKVRLNRAKALLRTSLSSLYKSGDVFSFHLSRCDRMVEQVLSHI